MTQSIVWTGVSALLLCFLASASRAGDQASSLSSSRTRVEYAATSSLDTGRTRKAHADVAWTAWGLTQPEWRRYQQLMHGIRGALSDEHISPVEVLGIHARSDEERRRYARLWTRMLKEDTERVLAFQRAVFQAGRDLYQGMPLIDPDLLQALRDEFASSAPRSDEFVLFASVHCESPCKSRMSRWIHRAAGRGRLDIYVIGAVNDDELRRWARRMRIDPAVVRERVVTLNHDDGSLSALSPRFVDRVDHDGFVLFTRADGKLHLDDNDR